jgi:hypothetical protein
LEFGRSDAASAFRRTTGEIAPVQSEGLLLLDRYLPETRRAIASPQ